VLFYIKQISYEILIFTASDTFLSQGTDQYL